MKGCQRTGSQLKRDARPARKTSHKMKRDSLKNVISLSNMDSDTAHVPLLKGKVCDFICLSIELCIV